jgi:hypothetical protein
VQFAPGKGPASPFPTLHPMFAVMVLSQIQLSRSEIAAMEILDQMTTVVLVSLSEWHWWCGQWIDEL